LAYNDPVLNKKRERVMDSKIRLTQLVKCAGCAGKLSPEFLGQAVQGIAWPVNASVLHTLENHEDCGVIRIDEENCLVQSTDFFTPVVDDPFLYGQIAAANALSDIYAMGAKPICALNIVCFPEEHGPEILQAILAGGAEKAREADCPILGGHSVTAPELKYGLAVTGRSKISEVIYNAGAKPGDALILIKPLGTGILNTALKQDKLLDGAFEPLINNMTQLNDKGGELMLQFGVHGATDVTGFSLMGHAMEMSRASKVDLEICFSEIPILLGVKEAIVDGCLTRGDITNREYTEGFYEFTDSISKSNAHLLFDPQTSGGLLMAIPEKKSESLVQALKEYYPRATRIGTCLEPSDSRKPGVIRVS
jgi:selenide, water dikinase